MIARPEDADVETASPGYGSRFDSPTGRWMLGLQRDIVFGLLSDLGSSSVLEVGGGHAQLAPALAEGGHEVSVLASSPQAVGAALRSAAEKGRVRVITGDLRNPPVEPLSVDVVLCVRLLAHAHDLPGLVAGLCRPARRAVIVDYASKHSFNAAAETFFALKKRVEGNTRPFRVIRDTDLSLLFRGNGFHLSKRRPQFFWPMALHRGLGSPGLSRGIEKLAQLLGLRALLGSPVIVRFDRD
jgi:SAM-dependent methyltransferase